MGLDERSHFEHKTWAPTRKIDRLNVDLGDARARIKAILEGDDMPQFSDNEAARLRDLLDKLSKSDVDMLNQVAGSARNAYKAANKTPNGYWARPAIEHLWNHPGGSGKDAWLRRVVANLRKHLRAS